MTNISCQDSIRSGDTWNQPITLRADQLGNMAARSVKWLLSSTVQVIGLTSLNLITTLSMTALMQPAALINNCTLVCLPNIDFSLIQHIPTKILWIAIYSIKYGVVVPADFFYNTLDKVLHIITLEVKDDHFKSDRLEPLNYFSGAIAEEIYCRYLIQQVALPAFANLVPESIGKVINHKFTRISLTSFLFALSHVQYWRSGVSFLNVFSSGLLYGTLAESTKSLKLPILVHALTNIGVTTIHPHYITYQSQCDFIETSH